MPPPTRSRPERADWLLKGIQARPARPASIRFNASATPDFDIPVNVAICASEYPSRLARTIIKSRLSDDGEPGSVRRKLGFCNWFAIRKFSCLSGLELGKDTHLLLTSRTAEGGSRTWSRAGRGVFHTFGLGRGAGPYGLSLQAYRLVIAMVTVAPSGGQDLTDATVTKTLVAVSAGHPELQG